MVSISEIQKHFTADLMMSQPFRSADSGPPKTGTSVCFQGRICGLYVCLTCLTSWQIRHMLQCIPRILRFGAFDIVVGFVAAWGCSGILLEDRTTGRLLTTSNGQEVVLWRSKNVTVLIVGFVNNQHLFIIFDRLKFSSEAF